MRGLLLIAALMACTGSSNTKKMKSQTLEECYSKCAEDDYDCFDQCDESCKQDCE